MGVKIISNSPAPWNVPVSVPVTRGLEGWFTFDTDSSRFAINRVKGKPKAQVIGTPVAYPTHGRFKGMTNYLRTAIPETDEFTFLVVGKAVVAPTGNVDGVALVASYLGDPVAPGITGYPAGANLFLRSAAGGTAAAARSDGAGGSVPDMVGIPNGSPTSWRILVARAKSGEGTKFFDLTNNTVGIGTDTRQRILNNRTLQIGSAYKDFNGESDISSVAIFSKALTDAEINATAALMRVRMARLGIVV